MIISARFASTCPRCNARIRPNTDVEWSRGTPARHIKCPLPVTSTGHPYTRVIASVGFDGATTAPVAPRLTVEDAGVYVLPDSTIVRVKATLDKQRTYATLWTEINATRATDAGELARGEYRYLPEARDRAELMSRVQATGRKMTAGEALAFSVRYGVCARCTTHLKAADSVYAGMGKTCAGYFGINQRERAKTNRAALAASTALATTSGRSYAEVFEDAPPAEQYTSDGEPVHPALATAADLPEAAAHTARVNKFRRRSQLTLAAF